jgi:hypothetical protein
MASDTTFDDFVQAGWAEHADHPEKVAVRLERSTALVESPDQFAPYLRLVTHVFGEHLGAWQRAITLIDRLRALPSFDGSATARAPIDHATAAMHFAAGDATAIEPLSAEGKSVALATVASAFAARQEFARAIDALDRALQAASSGLPDGSTALRALAVAGNNLAAALEEKPERNPAETAAMLNAAQAGLTYWRRAGGWLEEERAEYRLARSQLQASQALDAVASARRCVAVCRQNAAPAFEQFFAFAVLALAQRSAGDAQGSAASRAEALRLVEQVSPEERPWCNAELAELAAMH